MPFLVPVTQVESDKLSIAVLEIAFVNLLRGVIELVSVAKHLVSTKPTSGCGGWRTDAQLSNSFFHSLLLGIRTSCLILCDFGGACDLGRLRHWKKSRPGDRLVSSHARHGCCP